MRVAIDLLIAEKEPGGMLLAARALLNGLAEIDQANEYIIITGRPKDYQALVAGANIRIHAVKLRSWRGMLIKHQLLLPDILRRLQPDVLHVPAFAAPIGWHGPLVITVHDLAFLKVPDQSSLYARLYWQYLLRESVRRAQRIIVVSEHTCDELLTHWTVEKERIRLIHNALRPSLHAANISSEAIQEMRQRYGQSYLLHVGRIMPRKNVEKLIQAFDLLALRFQDLHVVLTGGTGYGSKEVLQQIEASPYRERIHQLGWVSDEDLGALYAGASALVFPSKHEGFGLPIVEAMACGTAVIASPEAASVEIAGEAVIRADCSSAPLLADTIARVLTDEALRRDVIQLGSVQAQRFTSEACASATRRVYEEALGIGEPPAPPVEPDSTQPTVREKDHPRASVIMPAVRPDQASQALESLSHQHYTGEIEIIVVGPIADELAQRWPIIPLNTGLIREPGRARNLGAARATGEVLLFLDDDCTVAEDWVERNVHALQRWKVGAVGACIRGKSNAFFARCVDFTNFGYYQHGHCMDGPIASASMGVVQSIFHMVGGFDETQCSGEDMDLCYRIQKQGYRTVYRPDIVVTHDHHRDTLGKLLRYNYAHGLAGGLATKIQHRDIGLKNRLLHSVRLPPVFLLLLPLIALIATVRIVAMNIGRNTDVLLYTPFILLGKLAYEFGVFRKLLRSARAKVPGKGQLRRKVQGTPTGLR